MSVAPGYGNTAELQRQVAALQARIAELSEQLKAAEARNAASERDAVQAGLFRRFVAFAKGRRAPTWMPQRFLDECRDVIEEKA